MVWGTWKCDIVCETHVWLTASTVRIRTCLPALPHLNSTLCHTHVSTSDGVMVGRVSVREGCCERAGLRIQPLLTLCHTLVIYHLKITTQNNK